MCIVTTVLSDVATKSLLFIKKPGLLPLETSPFQMEKNELE